MAGGNEGPGRGMLEEPLAAIHDREGKRVPAGLPPVVDAHVHLFPDDLSAAIRDWFDRHGWPIRYRLGAEEVISFLLGRGVARIVGLHYAHRPGVAKRLNRHMADLCRAHPEVTGFATVFPGEHRAGDILEEAFQAGLCGLKLHAHVQCFHPTTQDMHDLYEICSSWQRPLIVHAGREPKSPAYACDPHEICGAHLMEEVIKAHPHLRLCVPHLGADEYETYAALIRKYDTLWLDTTMMLGGYFPGTGTHLLKGLRTERVIYGTDFPNIPYAWDRELKALCTLGYPDETLGRVLGENALEFCDLKGAEAP